MAKHYLKLEYDEDAGTTRATHVVRVDVAGQEVSFAEEIDLEGESAALASLIDANRDEMEARATAAAVQHAAQEANLAAKGVKRLRLEGSVGPVGKATKGKGK